MGARMPIRWAQFAPQVRIVHAARAFQMPGAPGPPDRRREGGMHAIAEDLEKREVGGKRRCTVLHLRRKERESSRMNHISW